MLMNLFTIAASDMDVIIGIIAVVGWVLAQIFSKKKNAPTQQEEPHPESGVPLDPREELRKFFEGLDKPAKPAMAPPAFEQKPYQEAPKHRAYKSKTRTLSAQDRANDGASESVLILPEGVALATATVPLLIKHPRLSSIPELQSPIALRNFIVMNEILGKPIALRQDQEAKF